MKHQAARPLFSGVLTAVALCLFMAMQNAGTQEPTDFSKPPNVGIKFKVATKSQSSGETTITRGEDEPREMKNSSTGETTYTQTILKIEDGKILQLERQYEDASTKREGGRGGRRRRGGGEGRGGPQERESPLAWKHFRVTWDSDNKDDDKAGKVEVKDDDEWGEPGEELQRRVRPAMFRRPLFPLPKEPKSVGDTWELSEEDAKKWASRGGRRGFGRRGRGGRGGGRRGGGGEPREPPEMDVTTSLEFVEVTTHREMKCAVLRLTSKVEVGDTSTTTTTATAYYSLDHRLVVGIKRSGTSSMERTMERGEITMEMSSASKSSSTVRVDIVEPGKAPE